MHRGRVTISDERRFTASPGYAFGQLERAMRAAVSEGDRAARKRAQAKVAAWQAVLDGMATGRLTVGSRTPVRDVPAWVTLEVAHGGFATGRSLADVPLREDEVAMLPADAPGATDRERLNLWYLTDTGQAELVAALADESYRLDLPEDAALMVVAWLLDNERYEAALDLVAELRPFMRRLRMTPRLGQTAVPAGATVRLESVGTVRNSLRETTVPAQLGAMLETLRVWHPLYDRLVALWCDTVSDELPYLSDDGTVTGGWPCQVWPADWAARRTELLDDYRRARERHTLTAGPTHPRSNAIRLLDALRRCPEDSTALSGRDVGWVRRVLANTIAKHGAPGSERRGALRAMQAAEAARPTHATLAAVLAGRLDRYPEDGGIPSIDPIATEVREGEAVGVPAGHPVPPHLIAKVTRALEAPVEELVARNVITSGDVLARVLPQVTAGLLAANLDDPRLAALYAQTYAAFRRRRGLLLLNLEHQIRFEELPWIGVLEPLRTTRIDNTRAARHTLTQTTMLALRAFPYAILPNPLVRELGALAKQADRGMPLVEEVAADIFMGTFTTKWRTAASIASSTMANSLYANYFDLPGTDSWLTMPSRRRRWGKRVADDFAYVCALRAKEAHEGPGQSYVAHNGTLLEQSQILTTHNLAVLVDGLGLRDRVRDLAEDLSDRALAWVVRRQAMRIRNHHAALQMLKNTAYAWRQAIFFLSFRDRAGQEAAVMRLWELVDRANLDDRFGPAVDGLAHVVAGGRFEADGRVNGQRARRFLGWSVGPHWCLPRDLARLSASR